VAAHAKSEARVGELELLLDQERRRTKELRMDLMKELENEKQIRNQTDENLIRLKEETMKRELHDSKVIEDLELRINNINHEKASQQVEMDKKKEAGNRKVEALRDRHQALTDKYVSL
jgi:hypothetical protein